MSEKSEEKRGRGRPSKGAATCRSAWPGRCNAAHREELAALADLVGLEGRGREARILRALVILALTDRLDEDRSVTLARRLALVTDGDQL